MDKEHLQATFKEFFSTVYPWQKATIAANDRKMVEAIEKEAKAQAIVFTPVSPNVLQRAAEKFTAPDEMLRKLASASKRKALK